jgi:hypothetical protein
MAAKFDLDEFLAFWRDPKVKGALSYTVGGFLTLISLPGTLKEKTPHISEYFYGLIGVWVATIVSQGYVKGKAMEGTIPDGRQPSTAAPAAPAPTVVVNTTPVQAPNTSTTTTTTAAPVAPATVVIPIPVPMLNPSAPAAPAIVDPARLAELIRVAGEARRKS